jgi:hypothetical protein
MKTYALRDTEGRTLAFEVSNLLLGRRAVVRIVRTVPGVRITKEPRRWRLSNDEDFCEFELAGVRFVVSEPYGDNSRYWIGPQPPRWIVGVERVEAAFARAQPFWSGLITRAKAIVGYRTAG